MRDRQGMQRSDLQPAAVRETVFSVPAMTCRHCVRAVSAQIGDVVGVVAVEADVGSRTVRVRGTAQPDELLAAIAAAGHEAVVVSRSGRFQESTGGHLS
jgi:copper chaperone